MKSIFNFNMILFLSLAFIAGCEPQKETPVGTEQIATQLEKTKTVPVSQNEYAVLKGMREFVFSVEHESEFYTTAFIDPIISLTAYDSFMKSANPDSDFDLLRFYPAIENNRIFLIACLGKSDTNYEHSYMLMERTFYFNHGDLPQIDDPTNMTVADQKHRNYIDHVKLYRQAQNHEDSIRYSRGYMINEIDSLIQQNLDANNYQRNQLSLKFETGYLNDENADRMLERFNTSYNDGAITREHIKGFTVIISLIDQYGNTVVNPTSSYTSPDDYAGRYMEVGVPCPPRCGVLHQQ